MGKALKSVKEEELQERLVVRYEGLLSSAYMDEELGIALELDTEVGVYDPTTDVRAIYFYGSRHQLQEALQIVWSLKHSNETPLIDAYIEVGE